MVKNWKYFAIDTPIGELSITENQYMTGNILGLVAEKKMVIEKKGSLYDAHTYEMPVRMKLVDVYDGSNYDAVEKQVRAAITSLENEGCRCIISSGGELGLFDGVFHESELEVLSSPLMILDFALASVPENKKVCIVTDLNGLEIKKVINVLGLDEMIPRCIFTDSNLKDFRNLLDESCAKIDEVGAYIWDYPYDHGQSYISRDYPIYDIKRVSVLMGMSVAQKPYDGFI